MKRIFTCLIAVLFAVANWNAVYAVDYYKKHHINQNFDEIETLPADWTFTQTLFSSGGGATALDVENGWLRFTGSGSGNRGQDINFPTPQSNESFDGRTTFFLEIDWRANAGQMNYNNLVFFGLSGSGSQNPRSANNDWYIDCILGLYSFGDGYLYYWNMDLLGPETEIPGEYYGPIIQGGQYPYFARRDDATTLERTSELNAGNKMDVTFELGKTYHILAELDFATQKVVTLTVTDKENPENTQTITDKGFIAPTLAGSASTVAEEDRIVKDMSVITVMNTRSGGAAALDMDLDNMEIYALEESLGKADITIQYLTQDGETAKASRVAAEQEISTIYSLVSSDKERFIDGGYYYAYDADATHAANTEFENGESVTVVAGGASLTVVFKKTAVTNGEYVWVGGVNEYWSELDANFSVNGGDPIPYQNGNPVTFSNTDAIFKDVVLKGLFDLGEGDVMVEAAGYTFSDYGTGINRITGTGLFIVDAETTVGIDNRLSELVVLGTAPLNITHGSAAQKITLKADNAQLILNAGADLSMPIELDAAAATSGTLTIEALTASGYFMPFTNIGTLNVKLGNPGRLVSSTWNMSFVPPTPYEENMRINVTNICGPTPNPTNAEENIDNPIAGFSLTDAVAANVHVHLGDNVRLVRNYNEVAGGSVLQVGALTGTANSFVHAGWVAGRPGSIQVGALNTDHVFEGKFEKFYQFFTEDTKVESNAAIIKVGTGKWTLTNDQILDNGLVVNGGELELLGDIYIGAGHATANNGLQNGNVTVNEGGTLTIGGEFGLIYGDLAMASTNTTVNNGGTLNGLRGNHILSALTTISAGGTLAGDINAEWSLSMDMGIPAASEEETDIPASVWKPFISSFNADDYDKLVVQYGDAVVYGNFDITVDGATKGEKIQLIEGLGNLDVAPEKIFVNGVDITDFTEDTPGAEFVWLPETFELMSLIDKKGSGIDDIFAGKEVKHIEYYDLTGRQVSKNASGFVIQKITYTDGSVNSKKTYIFKN